MALGVAASFCESSHGWVAGPLKKSRKVGPKQKNTFFAARADRNGSDWPVISLATFWDTSNPLAAKFYNGLQKKNKEQLVFNLKIITN